MQSNRRGRGKFPLHRICGWCRADGAGEGEIYVLGVISSGVWRKHSCAHGDQCAHILSKKIFEEYRSPDPTIDCSLHLISASAASIEVKKEYRRVSNPRHPDPQSDASLPIPVCQFPIHRKDEHPFSELHIDIGEEAQDFGPSDLTDLLAEFVTALRD